MEAALVLAVFYLKKAVEYHALGWYFYNSRVMSCATLCICYHLLLYVVVGIFIEFAESWRFPPSSLRHQLRSISVL